MSVERYRLRVTEVEAIRLTSDTFREVRSWADADVYTTDRALEVAPGVVAELGDWVIRAPSGFAAIGDAQFHQGFELTDTVPRRLLTELLAEISDTVVRRRVSNGEAL